MVAKNLAKNCGLKNAKKFLSKFSILILAQKC
jgi:hypothetical protein